jgi:hypothetical protein
LYLLAGVLALALAAAGFLWWAPDTPEFGERHDELLDKLRRSNAHLFEPPLSELHESLTDLWGKRDGRLDNIEQAEEAAFLNFLAKHDWASLERPMMSVTDARPHDRIPERAGAYGRWLERFASIARESDEFRQRLLQFSAFLRRSGSCELASVGIIIAGGIADGTPISNDEASSLVAELAARAEGELLMTLVWCQSMGLDRRSLAAGIEALSSCSERLQNASTPLEVMECVRRTRKDEFINNWLREQWARDEYQLRIPAGCYEDVLSERGWGTPGLGPHW